MARLRSEREREHIKLLCDLAGNKDLGDEVTDAAKQLVLEFLRRPRAYPRPPPSFFSSTPSHPASLSSLDTVGVSHTLVRRTAPAVCVRNHSSSGSSSGSSPDF